MTNGRPSLSCRWHEELEDLQVRKRLAVQQWRLQRQAEQEALLNQPHAAEGSEARQQEQEQQQAARETERRQQQEQQRAAVAEWKQQREGARRREAEQQAAEQQAQKEQERQTLAARREQSQRALETWRQQQRLGQESSAGSVLSAGSRQPGTSRGDPETQQRLQERSQALLQRRQRLQARASAQEQEQQARLAQLHASAAAAVAPLAERDPGRLLQSTTAAQLRWISVAAEERTAKDSGYIRHVPRRATPVWCRQGAG